MALDQALGTAAGVLGLGAIACAIGWVMRDRIGELWFGQGQSLLLVTLFVALANIFYGFFPQFPLQLSSAAAELLLRHTL